MAARRYPLESFFGRILSPFEQFLRTTSAGGIVLMTATCAALALATWLGPATLDRFWERSFTLAALDDFSMTLSLHHWVNDGLMALFSC